MKKLIFIASLLVLISLLTFYFRRPASGVYNVLSIMINQKKREIAILRAIGYGPRKILLLILYQGLLLGIGGGLLGILMGYGLCQWIAHLDLAIEFHGSHHMPVSFDWRIYVAALISANVSALVASVIPAHYASRLTPIDILRSEA